MCRDKTTFKKCVSHKRGNHKWRHKSGNPSSRQIHVVFVACVKTKQRCNNSKLAREMATFPVETTKGDRPRIAPVKLMALVVGLSLQGS
uniref:60S ribosomal protein L29 n=1 Tax=Steinernema glaseri TaxID=37863 RepID=A0A1I8A7S0_9BILA